MNQSIFEKYNQMIQNDAKYFSNWLRWAGTEVTVLKPKISVIQEYVTAYGASLSTFERTPEYYDITTAYISLDPLEFGKKENVQELDSLIYSGDTELKPGYFVQLKRGNKIFTYTVDPYENYQNFAYRTILRLVDVLDLITNEIQTYGADSKHSYGDGDNMYGDAGKNSEA